LPPMKPVSVTLIYLLCVCARTIAVAQKPIQKPNWFAQMKRNFGHIGQSLHFGRRDAPDALESHVHYPEDHIAHKMAKEGKRLPKPFEPLPAVNHARQFGHLSNKQLKEIEYELTKYAAFHQKEIRAMRVFRRTLPVDPALWTEAHRKKFDERYSLNVKRVNELSTKSKEVVKKWRIPPKNIGERATTWVLDEEHLAMISEHLWTLAQTNGAWNERARSQFRKDLDKYIEIEGRVLQQKNDKKNAPPPAAKTQNGAGSTPQISDEAKAAHVLRKKLEGAVMSQRFRQEL